MGSTIVSWYGAVRISVMVKTAVARPSSDRNFSPKTRADSRILSLHAAILIAAASSPGVNFFGTNCQREFNLLPVNIFRKEEIQFFQVQEHLLCVMLFRCHLPVLIVNDTKPAGRQFKIRNYFGSRYKKST